MKKILLFILLIIFTSPVQAEELPDITKDIEIRTKWYREEEVGKYHPKGEDLLGYIENPDKITYSDYYSSYSNKNCLLSSENYLISQMNLKKYQVVIYTKYIKLSNFKYNDNVIIFNNGKKESFKVILNENNETVIELYMGYPTENLMLFVDYNEPYNITMYFDKKLTRVTLSKDINGEKMLIPDKSWITEQTEFDTISTENTYNNSGLVTYIGSSELCAFKQKYTYRYKIEKHYYDNEYHAYIEGYLPDMTDIKVFYKGEELIKTIEVPVYEKVTEYITKHQTIEVPKEVIKTVEVYPEKTLTNCECPSSSTDSECSPQVITEIQYVDKIKEVETVPKNIYILIISLTIIIIILTSYLIKKYVTW